MMRKLPNILTSLFVSTLVVVVALALPASALAASAYISPATGLITNSQFKVSIYVESTTGEPEIASATIKVNYPANINVVSINNGEFDSYLEKNNDPTTRQITVNAINNAGNYKSGQVKVASVNFEAASNTGDVQLTIDAGSSISGGGGEQLLTETINGVYTLDIQTVAEEDPATTHLVCQNLACVEVAGTGADACSIDADCADPGPASKGAVPETGIEDYGAYIMLSAALIGLGLLVFANPLGKNNGA